MDVIRKGKKLQFARQTIDKLPIIRDFPKQPTACDVWEGLVWKTRKRSMCFNLKKEKKTIWAKRFPINVNEGLSQKFFFSFFQHETRGQVLMLTSRAGSRKLPFKCNRPCGIKHTAGI